MNTKIIEYNRPIDDGFIGKQGTEIQIPLPTNPSKQVTVYAQSEIITGITRTATTVKWNATTGKWEVIQHFPYGRYWDQQSGSYDPKYPPDANVNLP